MSNILIKSLNRNTPAEKLGSLIICIAFSPGVFMESFWSDDYMSLMHTDKVVDLLLSDGRPTQAVATILGFSLIESPHQAWILRASALIAMIFLFLSIAKQIEKSRRGNMGIFAIAIAFCLPSFQMYIHWAQLWSLLWAALASVLALRFWSTNGIAKKFLGVLLLVFALTDYPPVALFYFSVIVIVNVVNVSKTSKILEDSIQGFLLFIVSLTFSIAAVSLSLRLSQINPTARVRLVEVSEIFDKVVWLFTRPIAVGLRPFMIDSPAPWFAVVSAFPAMAIIFFGIKAQVRFLNESNFQRLFLTAFLLVFTLLPVIVSPENQIEFRIIPGYCWGITSLVVYFSLIRIDQWVIKNKFKRQQKKVIFLLAPIALILVSVLTVNLRYFELFNNSYQVKNNFLNSKIALCSKANQIESITIIPPKQKFPSLKRLGVYSMSTDLYSNWVTEPNVELLLRESGVNSPVKYLENRQATINLTPINCLIDLEEFRQLLVKDPTRYR